MPGLAGSATRVLPPRRTYREGVGAGPGAGGVGVSSSFLQPVVMMTAAVAVKSMVFREVFMAVVVLVFVQVVEVR
jgi:hypothetical protein